MSKILIIDDEPQIVASVEDILSSIGFETITCTDGKTGFSIAVEKNPDLIILDWMMPEYSGLQFTNDYRREGYNTPILFLTARGDTAIFQVEALRQGADEYMSKPFDPSLLLARVNNLLKRCATNETAARSDDSSSTHSYCDGEFVIDFDAKQAFLNGVSCDLTCNEFKLVEYLEKNAGRVCDRDELLRQVWGYDFSSDVRTVDVTVRRTRKKVEPELPKTKYIMTRRGSGYYFPREFD